MFGKKKTEKKETSSKKTVTKKSSAKTAATKKPVKTVEQKAKGGESLPLSSKSSRSVNDSSKLDHSRRFIDLSATPSAASNAGRNAADFLYIANDAHYDQVIERIKDVKKTLWIGTADIKDLYVKDGRGTKPLLEVLSDLVKKGVAIRLIHAKEPGPAFRQDFDKSPALIEGMERVLCPRVHFKIIIFDLKMAYVGSANLTGAGIGMKGENTRNFEAGILSTNKDFVKNAAEQFDSVWIRLRASANVNNFLSCKRA